jgi:hypothetical protein
MHPQTQRYMEVQLASRSGSFISREISLIPSGKKAINFGIKNKIRTHSILVL